MMPIQIMYSAVHHHQINALLQTGVVMDTVIALKIAATRKTAVSHCFVSLYRVAYKHTLHYIYLLSIKGPAVDLKPTF